jgi:hypothetical protein
VLGYAQHALQIFATASFSSSDRVEAILSICTSYSAVAALAVKPNSSLYHAIKFLRVSLSLVIGWVLALAIKVRYYMAVVIVAWSLQSSRLTSCGHRDCIVVVVPSLLVVRSQMGWMN